MLYNIIIVLYERDSFLPCPYRCTAPYMMLGISYVEAKLCEG